MVNVFALLSGFLSFAAFAPLSRWWAAPISLTILLMVLQDRSILIRARLTSLYGLALFGPLLFWSNTYVGNLPWLILIVLQSFLILPLALFPFSRSRPELFFYFPSLFTALEALRSRFPFGGFGWGRMAFSQADSPYAGIAKWGGAPSLTFLVCTIAVAFLFISHSNWKLVGFSFTFLALLTPFFLNSALVGARNFSVLAVQGGVPEMGLDFNSRAREVFELHRSATSKYFALNQRSHPDLVLWPENAIDVDPLKDQQVRGEMQALVDQVKVPFVVGAVLSKESNYENVSILWKPRVGPESIYVKRHLTPFGEYIPLRPLAEFVSPYARKVVDFVPNDQLVIHRINGARIGPIICFELLDDGGGREMAAKSNLLVVQTNSATFGNSAQSAQQLGISRIRAIEHQRFIVSVATTGISAFIDPRGRIMQRSQLNEVATLSGKVGLINERSFSDRNGGGIELLLILLPAALGLIFTRLWRSSRKY